MYHAPDMLHRRVDELEERIDGLYVMLQGRKPLPMRVDDHDQSLSDLDQRLKVLEDICDKKLDTVESFRALLDNRKQ